MTRLLARLQGGGLSGLLVGRPQLWGLVVRSPMLAAHQRGDVSARLLLHCPSPRPSSNSSHAGLLLLIVLLRLMLVLLVLRLWPVGLHICN